MSSERIGFIVPLITRPGTVVWCESCAEEHKITQVLSRGPCPIFRENIVPYKQSCHMCHKLLVKGQTPDWPELFVSPIPPLTKSPLSFEKALRKEFNNE